MSYSAEVSLPDDASDAEGSDKVRRIGKTRVQFDIPPRSMKILVELKEKTDAASYAEVFKNALKLYDGIISEVERGGEFMIRDAKGNLTAFKMFL